MALRNKKFTKWLLLFLILAVGAHYGWKVLSEFNKLNLNRNAVYIEGNNLVSDNKIQTYLNLNYKQNILKINKKDLEKKLQKLDRIKKAEIKRDFPDGLKIFVEEIVPVGYTMKGAKRYVVTADGSVFEGAEGPPVKFLYESKEEIKKINRVLNLIKNSNEDFFSEVKAVDINYKNDVIIYIRTGWYMKLPPAEKMTVKMIKKYIDIAKKIQEKYKDNRDRFKYMDFRFIDYNEENIRGAVIVK